MMKIEPQSSDYLTAYALIDNEEVLLSEVEKFRQMTQLAREKGILSATKFEYKLLTKALDQGPEQLVKTIRHLTPENDQRKMMRLAEQANKFLPFVTPEQVLSDWAIKQINRYFVKGKLRDECEIKLQSMVEAMTDSFVVNALIEATRNDEDWQRMVDHITNNYHKLSDLKNL
ncbi:hypothetical protein V6C27_07760 [Peptococcaceae bacterium 1198_IL3148]